MFPGPGVKRVSQPPVSLGPLVRRHDPDRYFCALFAPSAQREVLFTLYAFNHELARANEVTREPGLALIRLQWWREVVLGDRKPHEVATPLRAAIAAGHLDATELLAMIEAREQETLADFSTVDAWRAWLLLGAGSLAVAAARTLGGLQADHARARALGAGYGVSGLLRSVRAMAAQGRCLLPADVLAAHGTSRHGVVAAPDEADARAAAYALIAEGTALLGAPRRAAGAWYPALLPAVLARRDLRRKLAARPRGLADQLAVLRAALARQC